MATGNIDNGPRRIEEELLAVRMGGEHAAVAGQREAERLGFRFDTVWEHELPGEMGQRAILIYRAPGGAGR